MKNKDFMTKIYNLSRSGKEWKYISFFEGALIICLVGMLIYQSSTVAVRLVPQFDMDKQYLTSKSGSDYEYLRIISESDLSNYTTWTPETIKGQFLKLFKRLSPSVYGKVRGGLLEKADKQKNDKISQSFMLATSKLYEDTNLVFEGYLKRYIGREEIFSGKHFYIFYYETINGIPLLIGIRESNNFKEAEKMARGQI